uniref:Antitoxin StbD n=1 Tax=Candidatus Kentrum sp. LPFa TaxID=2126335 RepID=A0A450XVC4_9GAMM|nr:MAG: antitoxin StbD [Candidatus Kentron sp. LPFa]VFK33225.1 MAG: antitoxin StbD [Candidatus Kentron sp. LPFa]
MANIALPETTANISQLRENPLATVAAGGFPVAIIEHDNPVFYCVPTQVYETLLNELEDIELNTITGSREDQAEIGITLDEL